MLQQQASRASPTISGDTQFAVSLCKCDPSVTDRPLKKRWGQTFNSLPSGPAPQFQLSQVQTLARQIWPTIIIAHHLESRSIVAIPSLSGARRMPYCANLDFLVDSSRLKPLPAPVPFFCNSPRFSCYCAYAYTAFLGRFPRHPSSKTPLARPSTLGAQLPFASPPPW